MGDRLKVFISYAHADFETVRKLHAFLQQQRCEPWLDKEDIIPGADWLAEIRKAIRAADLFLVCMSSHSMTRRGVLQIELKKALDAADERLQDDLFIVPVWIQGGSQPQPSELPQVLATRQWVNLSESDGHRRLLKAIAYQAARLQRDPPGQPDTPDTAAPAVDGALAESAVEAIRDALNRGDADGLDTAVQVMTRYVRQDARLFAASHGARALGMLARRAVWSQVRLLADALLIAGIDTPTVRRRYADALAHEGWFKAAADMLEAADAAVSSDNVDRVQTAEVRGRLYTALFHELHEQDHVGAAQALNHAIEACQQTGADEARRHLVLAGRSAALAVRAQALGVSLERQVDTAAQSAVVLEEHRVREDLAQAVAIDDLEAGLHAALCLGRPDDASRFLERCLAHPQFERGPADVLDLHLEALWDAPDAGSPAHALWRSLRERLARLQPLAPTLKVWRRGIVAPVQSAAAEAQRLEREFHGDPMRTLPWWRRGAACAQAVVAIRARLGSNIATGFLVHGRALHPSLPEEPLVLTASYVVSDDAAVRQQYSHSVLKSDEVQVVLADGLSSHDVAQVWSTFEGHTTILRLLRGPADLPTLEPATDPGAIRNAYVIGHPGGRELSLSVNDTAVIEVDERTLRYRTPTEAGSSGSPVLDDEWRLCGIHFGKVPSNDSGWGRANQAIRIDFLRRLIGQG